VVLVAMNPLFVGLASHLFLNERLSRSMAAGLAVAVAGSAIIGLGDLGEGGHRLVGDLMALVGALAGAGYFLIGRRLRARLSLIGYVFPVYAAAALILMTMAGLSSTPLSGYPGIAWLWLLLLALVPQIVGHSSLNWALRHLTATYVTLAVLAEPVGSTLLAWVVLGEPPTWATMVGGALILVGIVIARQGGPPARTGQNARLPKSQNRR
jgi:drug/metabolite transporter (DMT)-like permease